MTDPAGTAPALPSPRAPSALALFCTSWAALSALGLAFSAFLPDGLFRDDRLPAWARVTLAGTELTLLVVVAGAAAGIWALVERGAGPGAPGWRRGILCALRIAAVGLLLSVVAGSWVQYAQAGQFLDRISLGFAAGNFGALWHYAAVMYPVLLVLLPVAAFGMGAVFTEVLPGWLAARPRALRLLSTGVTAAVVAGAALALAGEAARRMSAGEVADPATGVRHAFREFYALRRDYRAGPVSHLLASALEGPAAPGDRSAARAPVREVRRPIVRLEAYLADAGPARGLRWNVILILVDSLRADTLRAGGARREVMPNVEALAREGRIWPDCLSTASHTDYASPSYLSSHYPLRAPDHHRYPRHPAYPRVLMQDILKACGHRTAVFSSQSESWGGMDHFLRFSTLDRFFDAETFARTPPRDPEAAAVARESARNPDPHIDDRFTVGEALAWIDAVRDGPFFVYLNLQGAHSPYLVPAGIPPRFAMGPRDFEIGFGNWPRDRAADVRDFYDDSAAYVDAQIGRLVAHLRARGLWDRTVLAVSGDHGEAFYEHGFAAHGGALYDEVVRVPLVLRAPGLAPAVERRPAQLLDIPPTVCHALGLPPHPAFQGVDLLGPGAGTERSRYLVAQSPVARQVGIVRGVFKLLYDAPERRHILYDLANDPGERRDISAERPEVLGDLKARLRAWFEAQVGYYRDAARQAAEYPPVLEEE